MAGDSGGIAGTGVSAEQVEGMAAGLDRLASAATGALSPTAVVVEVAGSAAGVPDPVQQLAKIAVGAGVGDLLAVVSGGFGLAADVMEAIAATQYHVRPDPADEGGGYAAPELLREQYALHTLLQGFDAVDNAGGLWFRDGKFGGLDMNAVANGDFPPELKWAVRYLQEHPERYCDLDRSDGFDGLVTREALLKALRRVEGQLEAAEGGWSQALSKLAAAREASALPEDQERVRALIVTLEGSR